MNTKRKEVAANKAAGRLLCARAGLRCWLQGMAGDGGYEIPDGDPSAWQSALCALILEVDAAREEFGALAIGDPVGLELLNLAGLLRCTEMALWNWMQGSTTLELEGDDFARVGLYAVECIERALAHPLLAAVHGNDVGGYMPQRKAA